MGTGSTTTKAGASTAAVAAAAGADTRTSTIVVAASNSLDPTLAPLLYRCSGALDHVEMNAALVAAAAVNGSVELLEGDYNTTLTLSVAVNVTLKAVGWGAVIHFNAGGNAITIAGDNVKLRDFKVVIVAGAGAGGTRPNGIYVTALTNVEINHLWLVGDETEADDGSNSRQCGILFGINMAYSKIGFCTIQDFERHGISFVGTAGNEVEYVSVEGNICYSIIDDGIRLEYALHCTVAENICEGNGNWGIYLTASQHNTVDSNSCTGNTVDGITMYAGSHNNTITGNTCQGNTSHGIYLNQSDGNTITGNTCQDNNLQGIDLEGADHCTVTGNTFNTNNHGIFLHGASVNCTMTGNTCRDNNSQGIYVVTADYHTITGNTCNGNDYGIYISNSDDCTITGNTCTLNTSYGIYLSTAVDCTVTGNTCNENSASGIRLISASNRNTISGNTFYRNARHGIHVQSSSNNTITGNTCNENDVNNTATYDGICIEDDADYNLVMGNTCNDNDRWGISIGIAANNCVENWVEDNQLRGNTSGPFNGGGTDTRLATEPFLFGAGGDAEGVAVWANFVSANASAKGWEVDDADDWAVALGQLPPKLQQVIRINIWAVALGAPLGGGGQMHLDILINGGASNLAYTTETIGLVNFDGEEADYINTDVVHWSVDVGDDADVADLVGGMSIECKVIYVAGDDPDGATNAVFRLVEIEYV